MTRMTKRMWMVSLYSCVAMLVGSIGCAGEASLDDRPAIAEAEVSSPLTERPDVGALRSEDLVDDDAIRITAAAACHAAATCPGFSSCTAWHAPSSRSSARIPVQSGVRSIRRRCRALPVL